jgi:hypothetical protein
MLARMRSHISATGVASAALLTASLLAMAAVAALARPSTPRAVRASVAAGARIAYMTGTARSLPQVWIAAASGAEPKRLGPGQQPLLAPDGQAVAASLYGVGANSEKGPAIGIYSALGTPVANYLDLETATSAPLAWSPDSRYLAVARFSTRTTNVAAASGLDVIDTVTGKVTPIAEGQISGASFARDGSDRVVYAVSHSLSPSASTNLYTSNPEGTHQERLTADGRSLNPVWGPRFIAFDKERLRPGDAPVYQIWLKAPAAVSARRLTNLNVRQLVSGLVPLAFSADGSRLLAEFEGQDTSEAWSVSVASGRARRVTVGRRSVQGDGISSDGSTILVSLGSFEEPPSNGSLATLPFAGGRAKVLIAHGAGGSWNG